MQNPGGPDLARYLFDDPAAIWRILNQLITQPDTPIILPMTAGISEANFPECFKVKGRNLVVMARKILHHW